MQTILVPTDFSENAFIAAQYAASLARETKANVHLFHVYIVLYAGFNEDGISVQHIEWSDTEASQAMDRLTKTLREQYPEVTISAECVRGFMIDELNAKLKKDQSIDLIVMGTKGVTNVAESIFGSTTFEVIKKSSVPVLVVPEDTGDFNLKHVGLFSDFHAHEVDGLKRVFDLFNTVETFDVIHFEKSGSKESEVKRMEWVAKAVNTLPDREIPIHTIPVETVDINAVTKVAENQGLDLLIFTRPHKSFFERIFGASVTKAAANYPVRPSLFVRE